MNALILSTSDGHSSSFLVLFAFTSIISRFSPVADSGPLWCTMISGLTRSAGYPSNRLGKSQFCRLYSQSTFQWGKFLLEILPYLMRDRLFLSLMLEKKLIEILKSIYGSLHPSLNGTPVHNHTYHSILMVLFF